MKKKLAIVLILILVVVNFPVYRLIYFMGFPDYYSRNEILKVLYIGSPWDRAQARDVMDLANEAFRDCGHSETDNEAKYGKLSKYASSIETYPETVEMEYSLKLWSAHLGKNEGWLWVYYSETGLDKDGEIDHGSWNVASLWNVEKDKNGAWMVTDIKEHP